MSEQMKPPPRRRTPGRILNTSQQTTAAPPTATELTREQLAAEEAAAESTSQLPHNPAIPTHTPAEPLPGAAPASTTAPDAQQGARAEGATTGGPAGAPPPADPIPAAVAPPADLALRPAPPAATAGPFPTAERRADPQGQVGGTSRADADSTPWTPGSGRPKDLPSAATVLNQRSIHRESLDVSVASALRLKKRLKRFALDNELDHLPLGDIVTVALDEWLTVRGF